MIIYTTNYDRYIHKCSKFFKNSIDQTIVEIKNDNIKNLNEIKKTFPFDEIRFSKYCKSIENLI